MTKTAKIILTIVLSLTTIVGGIEIPLLVMLGDDTNNANQRIIEENVSFETAINHNIAKAIDNVSNTGVIRLSLDKYEMNRILHGLSQEIKVFGVKFESIYVDFGDHEYNIFIPIKILGIKSLISFRLNLNESNDTFYLDIHDIEVGNLAGDRINSIIESVKEDIITLLSEYYVTTEFYDGGIRAHISRTELKQTVDKITAEEELHDIIMVAYDVVMLQTDAVKFNIANPYIFSIVVDLNCFGGYKSTKFDSFNKTMSEYVSSGIVNKDNINVVSKYIVNGYERLLLEERKQVAEVLSVDRYYKGYFSDREWSEGATNRVAYQLVGKYIYGLSSRLDGIKLYSLLLPPILAVQITDLALYIGSNETVGKTYESDLNNLVNSFDFVGTTIPMMCEIDCKVSHIIVDSAKANISYNGIDLELGIDINGFVIPISIKVDLLSDDVEYITLQISEAKIGTFALKKDNINAICEYVDENVNVPGVGISNGCININTVTVARSVTDVPFFSNRSLNLIFECIYIDFDPRHNTISIRWKEEALKNNVSEIAKSLLLDFIDYFT